MKIRLEAEMKLIELRKKYSGTMVIKIPEHEVIKNFTFTICDPEDESLHLIIQEVGGKLGLDLQGATEEAFSALSPDQAMLLRLTIAVIEDSTLVLNGQYDASPEARQRYQKVEKLAAQFEGSVEFSTRISREVVVDDAEAVRNILQVLQASN